MRPPGQAHKGVPGVAPARYVAAMTVERTEPPKAADELTMLTGFLDWQRDTLRRKCEGLTAEQLARPLRAEGMAPTRMTLGGLLKHLTVVEAGWLNQTFAGGHAMPSWLPGADLDDRDWSWATAKHDSPEQLFAWLAETQGFSSEILAAADGLDARSVELDDDGQPWTLRWILCHLIEEYARHNGHADLLRESIDGATGE